MLWKLDASETEVSLSMAELKTAEEGLQVATLTWWGKLLIGLGAAALVTLAAFVLKKGYVGNKKLKEK